MQITINLPPNLAGYLLRQAVQSDLPLSSIVLQILRQLIPMPQVAIAQWPQAVLAYEPSPGFPEFESYRNELVVPQEIELF